MPSPASTRSDGLPIRLVVRARDVTARRPGVHSRSGKSRRARVVGPPLPRRSSTSAVKTIGCTGRAFAGNASMYTPAAVRSPAARCRPRAALGCRHAPAPRTPVQLARPSIEPSPATSGRPTSCPPSRSAWSNVTGRARVRRRAPAHRTRPAALDRPAPAALRRPSRSSGDRRRAALAALHRRPAAASPSSLRASTCTCVLRVRSQFRRSTPTARPDVSRPRRGPCARPRKVVRASCRPSLPVAQVVLGHRPGPRSFAGYRAPPHRQPTRRAAGSVHETSTIGGVGATPAPAAARRRP